LTPTRTSKWSGAQATEDLDAFDRIDVGVQVFDLQAAVPHEVGEVLGHPLRERGDQGAVTARGDGLGLADDVLHLAGDGPDFHDRVEEARRADDLLGDDGRDLVFVGRRGGGDVDRLRDQLVELLGAQGAVLERGGQAEAELDEALLAGAVAVVHPADLRDRDVALVDEDQLVLREEVQEAMGALPGPAAGHVHRVVLDARAEARLAEHLEVVLDAHPEALRLHEAVRPLEVADAFLELRADGRGGGLHAARGHSRTGSPGRGRTSGGTCPASR